LELG
jgi:hypothetical protein